MPILLIIALESLFVRAHGNWAAVSFVALVILFVSFFVSKNIQILFINNVVNLVFGLVFFCLILIGPNFKVLDQLRGYDDFSKLLTKYAMAENIRNFVIQERMLYSLVAYHLRGHGYVFYTPRKDRSRAVHHFQINKGLSENFNKNFVYLGNPSDLNYLKKTHKKILLKNENINQKVKNVSIYKYIFN